MEVDGTGGTTVVAGSVAGVATVTSGVNDDASRRAGPEPPGVPSFTMTANTMTSTTTTDPADKPSSFHCLEIDAFGAGAGGRGEDGGGAARPGDSTGNGVIRSPRAFQVVPFQKRRCPVVLLRYHPGLAPSGPPAGNPPCAGSSVIEAFSATARCPARQTTNGADHQFSPGPQVDDVRHFEPLYAVAAPPFMASDARREALRPPSRECHAACLPAGFARPAITSARRCTAGSVRDEGRSRPGQELGWRGRARTSNIRLQRPAFCRLNYPPRGDASATP